MSRSSLLSVLVVGLCSYALAGCAGMIVGSHDWFEKKRPDVEPQAAADLGCTGKPIAFSAPNMGDYREVEARGCAKKVRYKLVKVAFTENWVKSSEVSAM